MSRLRQWLAEQRAARRPAARTALIVTIATVALAIGREVLVSVMGNALLGAPVWLGLAAILVILVGWLMFGRRDQPRPDAPPATDAATGHPVLPPLAPVFVDRETDLADVVELVARYPLVAVVGRRAVGTSAFALRVAHQLADRFADGQVYLDLRGAAAGTRLTAARALRRVLHRLGLPEPRSNRPSDLDNVAEALDEWLRTRKVLLLLDNVDHPDQVGHLLPAGPDCRVLLVGSVDLQDLPNVRVHHLPELAEDAAVELLGTIGDLTIAGEDRSAAGDLVNRCGRQPEAVRLLGRLIREGRWPLADVVDAIRQGPVGTRPEAEYAVALRPVWEACEITLMDLSPAHRRLFHLLALVPTTEIGTHAAAALAGAPWDRTTQMLADLDRRGLVESTRPGHYRIRQLLATSARFRLGADNAASGGAAQLNRAVLRLARYYALLTEEFAELLLPVPDRTVPGRPVPDNDLDPRQRERTVREARRWLQQDQDLLFHLVTNRDLVPARRSGGTRPDATEPWLWRLAVALCTWYAVEDRLADWQEVCEAVLALRIARTNPAVAFWAHNELAVVHRRRDEPLLAWQELRTAMRLGGGRGRRGLAQAQTNMGLALLDLGQLDAALHHLEVGLRLRSRADRHGQGISALGLGAAHVRAGELEAAHRHLTEAINIFDALGDERGAAAALNNLGIVLAERGDRFGARENWELAGARYRRLGDDAGLASVLLNMATYLDAPPEEAVELLTESLRLRGTRTTTRDAALARLRLGDALDRCGKHEQASEHWHAAARILLPLGGTDAAEAVRRIGSPLA